jgi:hypothetical protein
MPQAITEFDTSTGRVGRVVAVKSFRICSFLVRLWSRSRCRSAAGICGSGKCPLEQQVNGRQQKRVTRVGQSGEQVRKEVFVAIGVVSHGRTNRGTYGSWAVQSVEKVVIV